MRAENVEGKTVKGRGEKRVWFFVIFFSRLDPRANDANEGNVHEGERLGVR